jgi:RNA 3'-terminal phosphate cyclase (ATP)
LTTAKLCNAEAEGARINSRELWFKPGEVEGGKVNAEIGTAGSIPMLMMTVLPVCAYAKSTVDLHVSKGGTDVSNAPTINYMRFILLPTLCRMGLEATLKVHKYGYFPKGNGEITAKVKPAGALRPLHIEKFGNIKAIKGISVCTFLADRKVAERQANAANDYLREKGQVAEIQVVNDTSNPFQKGSSIVLWAETDTGTLLGADAIGELRKTSEKVGEEAAQKLSAEISAKPTVDVHLADLLTPYMALAKGNSVYFTRTLSEHLETNIWVAEQILNVKFSVEKLNGLYRVEKKG